MKKLLTILILFSAANMCHAYSLNGFSEQFARKFENCDIYKEKISFHANGTVYHDSKSISGWYGGFCGYKQSVKTANATLYVSCAFTKPQVAELHQALLLQPERFGAYNKTQEIWDKFVLDKNNCTLSGKNIYSKGFTVDKIYLPNF